MSEQKRAQLAETLTLLDTEDRAWAINFLVHLLSSQATTAKKKTRRTHNDNYSEQDWEEYFRAIPQAELPKDTESTTKLLHETAGKTIKPIEKWL